MARRILFIINPIAGTRGKTGLEQWLHQKAKQAGFAYQFFYTGKNTTRYEIQFTAEEFEATDLIACGGDGTVNLVASAVAHQPIYRLGIIAVGSGNGLARCANIPMKPSLAWNIILQEKELSIDSFLVNRHFSCMLTGIGFDAAVAARFAQSKKRGLLTYTRETMLEFLRTKPFYFEVEMNGQKIQSEAFFISIANSNQFGNNVTIAPLASLQDGMVDLVIAGKMPKTMLPFALAQQIVGKNKPTHTLQTANTQGVQYIQATEFVLHNPGLAPMHIDGDPVTGCEEIRVKVQPASVRLLIP